MLIRHTEAAGRMVMHLSDMLRMTLRDSEHQETTLERELRFLRLYLEIEQARFRDRLRVCWAIAPGLEQAAVPTLLASAAGRERAAARPRRARNPGAGGDDDMLTLRVADDGIGLDGGGDTSGAGIGIPSTRARLAGLYGSRHQFAIEEREGGGVSVTVRIPYRRLKEADGD